MSRKIVLESTHSQLVSAVIQQSKDLKIWQYARLGDKHSFKKYQAVTNKQDFSVF